MRRRPTSSRRSSHTLLRWESLGHAVTGLEALEQRQLMAADLAITLNDDLVAGITRQYYTPGSQVVYTLKVTNTGDTAATGATLTTSLAPAITQATWTAAYSGAGTQGDLTYDDSGTPRPVANVRAGMGNLNMDLTVAAGGTATFTIIATVGGTATGDLVSSAQVVLGADTKTASDTDRFVPAMAAVTNDAIWTGSTTVRLVNPKDGTTLGSVAAFAPGTLGGARAALGDVNGDGKPEIVCVTGTGTVGTIAVFRLKADAQGVVVDGQGKVTLESYPDIGGPGIGTLVPFAGYRRGLEVVAGDFTGDGVDDIAVAQGGSGSAITIYRATPLAPQKFVADKTFTIPQAAGPMGVSLAVGDFGTFANGVATPGAGPDGRAELVVASGAGVSPVVAIVDLSGAKPAVVDTIRPFSSGFVGGVSVTVARIGRDSIPDLVVAQGRGGESLVQVFDGRKDAAKRQIASFAAFADLGATAAISASAQDTDGDGRANRIDVVQTIAGGGSLRSFTVNTAEATGTIAFTQAGGATPVAGRLRIATAALRNTPALVTTDSGLQYIDLVPGTGAAVGNKAVKVDYTGTYTPTAGSLAPKVFDSSKVQKGTTTPSEFSFTVGSGQVIKGWDEGVASMKVGGIRQLIVPNYLGYKYSQNGQLNTTSPYKDSTLTFEVQAKSSP